MSNIKATILLPVRDNNGNLCLNEKNDILADILASFGGYAADEVQGAYTMADGSVAYDDSIRLVIVTDKLRVPELRAMVASWGKLLRQETMYLDVEPSNVEFVASARDRKCGCGYVGVCTTCPACIMPTYVTLR